MDLGEDRQSVSHCLSSDRPYQLARVKSGSPKMLNTSADVVILQFLIVRLSIHVREVQYLAYDASRLGCGFNSAVDALL